MKELYRIIDRLEKDKSHELITITSGADAGEEILLTDGQIVWSSCEDAQKVLEQAPAGGIFREKLASVTDLVVCGCGFVGLAVMRLGKFLGWHVTALDDREEFTDQAKGLGADTVICGALDRSLEQVYSDSRTCYVVVTRDHDHDKECLEVIVKRPAGYVGMMGSRLRAQRMKEYLKSKGLDEAQIARIHAPVGLSIRADTPEEIAISIIAQIIQEKGAFSSGSIIPGELQRALNELCEGDGHAVMAVVTARKGSTPREPGARMLVYPDGRTVGTIGGGSMEAEVIKAAVDMLEEPHSFSPHVMAIDLTGQTGDKADMVCGGSTEVFLNFL